MTNAEIRKRMQTLQENIQWLTWATGQAASVYNDLRLSYDGNCIALERAKTEYEALKGLLAR